MNAPTENPLDLSHLLDPEDLAAMRWDFERPTVELVPYLGEARPGLPCLARTYENRRWHIDVAAAAFDEPAATVERLMFHELAHLALAAVDERHYNHGPAFALLFVALQDRAPNDSEELVVGNYDVDDGRAGGAEIEARKVWALEAGSRAPSASEIPVSALAAWSIAQANARQRDDNTSTIAGVFVLLFGLTAGAAAFFNALGV